MMIAGGDDDGNSNDGCDNGAGSKKLTNTPSFPL